MAKATEKLAAKAVKSKDLPKPRPSKADLSKNTAITEDQVKDREIKTEIARWTKLLKEIDGKKRLAARGLIEEAAFMRSTLKGLKDTINGEGPLDLMTQGDYTILREHPAVKAYNTMLQRYSTVHKMLLDLLPKEVAVEQSDGFEDFVGERSD